MRPGLYTAGRVFEGLNWLPGSLEASELKMMFQENLATVGISHRNIQVKQSSL